MNLLFDKSAPYILTLLISLTGWYFTYSIQSTDQMQIVTYSLSHLDGGQIQLHIHNRSLKKTLERVHFSLLCTPHRQCFQPLRPDDPARLAQVVFVEPWGGVQTSFFDGTSSSNSQLTFQVDLPAGGEIDFKARLADGAAEPAFYYLPQDKDGEIRIIPEPSLVGFVLDNFYTILFAAFCGTILLLVAWIALNLIYYAPDEPAGDGEDGPSSAHRCCNCCCCRHGHDGLRGAATHSDSHKSGDVQHGHQGRAAPPHERQAGT